MSFLGKFVGPIGVLACTFVVPVSRRILAFFIVFGGRAMSAGRELVLLGGLTM